MSGPQINAGDIADWPILKIDYLTDKDKVAALLLFIIAGVVIWFYDSGSKGIKLFELMLKILVAVIVASFFAVVFTMATRPGSS